MSSCIYKSGLDVIKLFSCSTQQSITFIFHINVKMSIIVDILTIISMINTTLESLKARDIHICQHISFKKQLKFHAQLSLHVAYKKLYDLGTDRSLPIFQTALNPDLATELSEWKLKIIVVSGKICILFGNSLPQSLCIDSEPSRTCNTHSM